MDFTALKTAIQNAVKLNGNEEITGDILQGVLLSMVSTLGDSAINDLVTAISNEATARQNGDSTLNGYITALQGAVNSINTAIENGFVYAGIATPTTTPATGKVFYIALTAGTYTNFGNTEVSQGINILKYNGSAWSLDVVIALDDTPTPSSTNLVKSGGVFDKVITDGSAFDISAHFSSGGTLATYADLNAALTALNTLSAPYKRGGMSIKFVQSSDNKYVQARCMVNEFTTDVTKWQGVDDVPTAGSDNLVKSGGVNERFSSIDGVIDDGTTYKDKFGNTNRTCVFYPIPDVDATYKINVHDVTLPTGNHLYLAIRSGQTPYSATYLALIGQGDYSGDTGEILFDIPESVKADARYISVNQMDASSELCQFSVDLSYNGGIVEKNDSEIRNSITELKDRVSKLDGIIDGGTTYNKKDATSRVCVYYPIPDVNATYKLKLSNVVLSDSTNEIWAAIRSDKTPYSATALGGIGAGFFNDDAEVVFIIPDNIKAYAKYIALTQASTSGEASFKVELEYETNTQKTITELQEELLPIDKGTTYSEKFGTTQRTCVFYPIPDKTKEYRIILNDVIIPSDNEVRVFVAKAQSPYDTNPTGNVLQLVGEVNLTGEALDKTFTINESVRSDANYIAVCQLSADLSLCSFNSKIYTTGTIYAQIEDAEQDVEKDVIPYNDSVFAKGRTLKIYNPYKDGGNNQYAGQMHCHSWNYEEYNGVMYKVPIAYTVEQIAAMTPEERNAAVLQTNQTFVAAHKTVGYDFMTITNYDQFLDYSEAPNVLPNDFLWIGNGFESNTGGWDDTGQAEDRGAHLGIINTNFCEKFRDWTPKEIVDYCEDKNCIVIYNHPFLSALYSSPDFVKNIKSRLRFIEVYNGLSVHHADIAPGVPSIKSGIMLDEDYDALISQGNFTFCIAASDERILRTDIPDLKWGCIKVFANELSHKSIINALLGGNFYATSLLDIEINGVIIADGQYKVDVGIEDVIVEFIGKDNTVLSTVTTSAGNTIASYNIIGTEDFVRARIYKLNSEPYDADAWHKNKEWIIWTQPIFIAKELL